jgi:uncharacterized MAPEG superfamily protein
MKSLTRTGAVAAFMLAVAGDPLQALAIGVALWLFERLETRS